MLPLGKASIRSRFMIMGKNQVKIDSPAMIGMKFRRMQQEIYSSISPKCHANVPIKRTIFSR